ncbi:MAG: hypothetical protein ACO1N1_09180 [Dyadobacter fermentans]
MVSRFQTAYAGERGDKVEKSFKSCGAATAHLADGGSPWVRWYAPCDGDLVPSGGGITIDKYEVVNGVRFIQAII